MCTKPSNMNATHDLPALKISADENAVCELSMSAQGHVDSLHLWLLNGLLEVTLTIQITAKSTLNNAKIKLPHKQIQNIE